MPTGEPDSLHTLLTACRIAPVSSGAADAGLATGLHATPSTFVWPQLRNIEGRSRDRELLRALTGCVAESPARRFAGEFALADERVIGGHAVVQFARAAGQDVAIKCATLRDLDRGLSR